MFLKLGSTALTEHFQVYTVFQQFITQFQTMVGWEG